MISFRLFLRNIGSFSLHTKTPYDHMVCHDFDPRTFCILKGTGRKWATFVSVFFFIVWKTCIESSEFTHTKIPYHPRVCHELDPGPGVQCQRSLRHIHDPMSFWQEK